MSDQAQLSIGALILLAPHINRHVAFLMCAAIFAVKGAIWIAGGAP